MGLRWARRGAVNGPSTGRGCNTGLVTDDASARFSNEIRRRAGFGTPVQQPQDAEQETGAEPEQTSPDFAARVGQRRALPVEEDMNTLLRAAFYGEWRRPPTGGP